jgi:DNA (cytosine-5)-methyltransferase 1
MKGDCHKQTSEATPFSSRFSGAFITWGAAFFVLGGYILSVTFGSLFAGIGGFDLGFERAGMSCKWQVEIDDYATKVLEKHWPETQRKRDVRECGGHNLSPVGIICGGFPCQDISYAGRGAGLDGERSGLFFEAIRLVCELQPRVVVLENVAALLTRGLDRVLGTLAEVGYDAEWHCIPAASVGAPHSRDRTFVIAYTNSDGVICRPIISEMEWMCGIRGWCEEKHGFGRVSKSLRAGRLGDFSGVPRMDSGVPNRLDKNRLRGPGNAVVPQVAEFIGRKVLSFLNKDFNHE